MDILKKILSQFKNNVDNNEPDWLDEYLEQDHEENKTSSLPEGESVIIPSIKVAEAYTPSTIKELREGILKFGLDNYHLNSNRDLIFMMEKYRSSNTGWYNIGYLSEDHLPNKIKSISLSAFQPSPSLTIVVFNFQFQDEESKSLNNTLRKNYKSYATKIGSDRHSIYTPYHQRKREINQMREYLFSICTEWISEHFRGLFSSNIIDTKHPRMEMLFLKKNRPFSDLDIERKYKSYLYALDLGDNQEYLTSERWDNIYFKFYNDTELLKNGIVVTGKIDEMLQSEDLDIYGSGLEHVDKVCRRLEYFEKTFMIISLQIISKFYFITANNLRDKYGELSNDLESMEEYSELEKEIFLFQKDAIHICKELEKLNYDHGLFKIDVYDLKSSLEYKNESSTIETLSNSISYYSEETINRIEQVISLGNNLSQFYYSLTNKKRTQASNKMTGILVVLTIVLTILTYILVAKELLIWPFGTSI